jgi:hypothetical protein
MSIDFVTFSTGLEKYAIKFQDNPNFDITAYTIDLLTVKEKLIVFKKGKIYLRINLEQAYDQAVDCLKHDDTESFGPVFPISYICRYNEAKEDEPFLLFTDDYFGYNTADGDGIVGISYADLKKYYESYRINVDKSLPAFDDETKRLFGNNYQLFKEIMLQRLNVVV